MKRKSDLIASLVAIILILAGTFGYVVIYKGTWRPFSASSEWEREALVLTSEDYNTQNPDIIELSDGCYRMYTHGWPEGENYSNSIYSFYSCDGLNWEPEGLRIEGASMPAAVMLDDGRIRLYHSGTSLYEEGEDEPYQTITSSISDDGLNFTAEETNYLITEHGELKDIKTIAHFEIIKLDQGFRLYFDEGGIIAGDLPKNKGTGWEWPVHRIRSAYSEDGLNWKLDPGIRIDIEQSPLDEMQRAGSCTVIKVGDEYQMYFSAGFSPWEDWKPYKRWEWSGTYMATSEDGLDFSIVDKRLVLGGDPKVIKIGDVLRLYISEGPLAQEGKNNIYSYVKK